MRQPKEVTKDEYDEFYKTTFKLYDEPMAYSHFMLEGQVEFRSVLFLPTDVPWELSQDMFNEVVKNVRLYVKRVFISESFKDQLLPRWLTFIKAIVDSDDLPLNVSRELLQKSRVLNIISKRLVRKAIDMFADLKEESPEKFTKLQRNFGQYLKVGVIEDNDNKERLLNLACFKSSSEEGRGERGTNLEEYVQRMPEGQKQIYYIAGSSRANAESSPVLEKLKKRGYEVLFALDQIDEIALQGIGRFKATGDKEFAVIDASKEDAKLDDLTEEEKKVEEKAKEDFADTLAFIKETLGSSKVDKVEVSTRLVDSPSALVQPQWGMSPQMQRFMKQRAKMEGEQVSGMNMAANLEVNTAHPAVQKVKTLKESGNEAAAKDMANLIYDVAAISSGYDVAEPASFAKRVIALMAGEELGQDATGAGAEDTKPKDSGKDEPDIQTPDPSDVEVID
jgi:heat shock protein beta